MKKYLPFIIFLAVFLTVLVGQIVFKMVKPDAVVAEYGSKYNEYESIFLNSSYKTIEGNTVQMSNLTSPVVIYNFWASWCIPCLEEMPSMISMKKKFSADKIQIIAINTDEEEQMANIQKTIKKIELKEEFTIVPDKNAELVTQFNISAIPVTIVFHRGKVVHFSNGPMDFISEEFLEQMKGWTAN